MAWLMARGGGAVSATSGSGGTSGRSGAGWAPCSKPNFQLIADAAIQATPETGPGGRRGASRESSAAGSHPHAGTDPRGSRHMSASARRP